MFGINLKTLLFIIIGIFLALIIIKIVKVLFFWVLVIGLGGLIAWFLIQKFGND